MRAKRGLAGPAVSLRRVGKQAAWVSAAVATVSIWGCVQAAGSTPPPLVQAMDVMGDSMQSPCLIVALPTRVGQERAELRAALRVLARAGWLKENDRVERRSLGPRNSSLWMPTSEFELTESGRRHYDARAQGVGGFCH